MSPAWRKRVSVWPVVRLHRNVLPESRRQRGARANYERGRQDAGSTLHPAFVSQTLRVAMHSKCLPAHKGDSHGRDCT